MDHTTEHQVAPWAKDSTGQETRAQEPAQPEKKPFSAFAILGLVFALPLALAGLIFSLLGLKETKNGAKRGRGLAIAGLILSILNAIAGAILGVLLAQNLTQAADNLAGEPTSVIATAESSAETTEEAAAEATVTEITAEDYYAAHPEINPAYCEALTAEPVADNDIEGFAQWLEKVAETTTDEAVAKDLRTAAFQARAVDTVALDANLFNLAPTLLAHESACSHVPAS